MGGGISIARESEQGSYSKVNLHPNRDLYYGWAIFLENIQLAQGSIHKIDLDNITDIVSFIKKHPNIDYNNTHDLSIMDVLSIMNEAIANHQNPAVINQGLIGLETLTQYLTRENLSDESRGKLLELCDNICRPVIKIIYDKTTPVEDLRNSISIIDNLSVKHLIPVDALTDALRALIGQNNNSNFNIKEQASRLVFRMLTRHEFAIDMPFKEKNIIPFLMNKLSEPHQTIEIISSAYSHLTTLYHERMIPECLQEKVLHLLHSLAILKTSEVDLPFSCSSQNRNTALTDTYLPTKHVYSIEISGAETTFSNSFNYSPSNSYTDKHRTKESESYEKNIY